MKLIIRICFSLCVFILVTAKAQKMPIDTAVFGKWPGIGQGKISNNGKYVMYTSTRLSGSGLLKSQLTIQDTKLLRSYNFENVSQYEFSDDNNFSAFIKSNDSLGIVNLRELSVRYIANVTSFKFCGSRLVYEKSVAGCAIALINLTNLSEFCLPDAFGFVFDLNRNRLFYKTWVNKKQQITRVSCLSLTNNKITTIWQGHNINDLKVYGSGYLAFIAEQNNKHAIWLYKDGHQVAGIVTDDDAEGMPAGFYINNIRSVAKDGKEVYFSIKASEKKKKPTTNALKVDIWSYLANRLPSDQLSNDEVNRDYLAVSKKNKVFRIEWEKDWAEIIDHTYAVIQHRNGDGDDKEVFWNRSSMMNTYIFNYINGAKKLLPITGGKLSPDLKALVYYNAESKNYFKYCFKDGKNTNLTERINVKWTQYKDDTPDSARNNYDIVAWSRDGGFVFLQDEYDIWKVDLSANRLPINITNGYGRKHKILFSLLTFYKSKKSIDDTDILYLSAFNRLTKENGFYTKRIWQKGDPEELTMGAYIYNVRNVNRFIDPDGLSFGPIAAKGAKAFLVTRMSSNESPNFFFTTDFKVFKPLSHIYPENEYNWLTTTLVNWITETGIRTQGILYKPENFNQNKKYPVILYYYERLSDNLNLYINPEASSGPINIPWFVSNGYLVFTPDIYYRISNTGESALETMVSAAKYLSGLAYVDKAKIGIQGHSFGGYETNFIITHSNIFAAACTAAGVSNFVSAYGQIGGGKNRHYLYEVGQSRMGTTLWQNPNGYIKNSPIFNASKVTTPLLMMYNKEDSAVPFSQGLELFSALRRLGKRAWLLQYDGQEHRIDRYSKEALDYNHRLTQFFDHYLKNSPPPKWMTRQISTIEKFNEIGYEYDTEIETPGLGLISEKEQKKIDGYSKIPSEQKLNTIVEKQ
jgi:dipeptidyl aminopeptidase/acylaminoacyl peptidase